MKEVPFSVKKSLKSVKKRFSKKNQDFFKHQFCLVPLTEHINKYNDDSKKWVFLGICASNVMTAVFK